MSAYLDDSVRGGDNPEAVVEARRDLLRLLGLANSLAFVQARREDIVEAIATLAERGLIEEDGHEAGVLRGVHGKGVCPTHVVYGWFLSRWFRTLRDVADNTLSDAEPQLRMNATNIVQVNITACRGAAADLMMYLNQPIPFLYTHLLELMVNLYLVCASIGLVPKMLWLAPPVAGILCLVVYGFFTVSVRLFDPFKDDSQECLDAGHTFCVNGFTKDLEVTLAVVENTVPLRREAGGWGRVDGEDGEDGEEEDEREEREEREAKVRRRSSRKTKSKVLRN